MTKKEKRQAQKQFGHPEFYKLLDQMAALHSRKNHDYAGIKDPLKNLRACERLSLEPFLGVMVRLQDKWSRLEEFVNSGQLLVKDESVIDTLMDNAVYSLLAIILYKEQQKKGIPPHILDQAEQGKKNFTCFKCGYECSEKPKNCPLCGKGCYYD